MQRGFQDMSGKGGGYATNTALKAEVEQRIGRNLLRYQLVEWRLKAALPLRRITLSAEGVDALERSVSELGQFSLGRLKRSYTEAFR